VTAVLLNFRAYDTLLEVFVLFVAVIAVFPATLSAGERQAGTVGPVLRTFTTLFVPLTVLVATYVLWTGTKAPGGAFQAAAMLAAGSIFLIVCGARPPSPVQKRWRLLLVVGLVVFLLVGLGGIAVGGRFLEFRPPWAGPLITVIETALAASIALILVLLFCGTSPDESEHTAFQEITR
jgi:multisubunit Na+/H+ antiporter MnhB subunit